MEFWYKFAWSTCEQLSKLKQMTTYSRRPIGTAFVLVMSVLDLIFGATYAAKLHEHFNVDHYWIAAGYGALGCACLFKLGFHAWVLKDPTISVNEGDKIKNMMLLVGVGPLNLVGVLILKDYMKEVDVIQAILQVYWRMYPLMATMLEIIVYRMSFLKVFKPWEEKEDNADKVTA
jgi:hypothetical protein